MSQTPTPRPTLWLAFSVLTGVALAASFYAIFFVAPVEEQMGIVQKIFYLHVPSAYCMYVGFGLCVLGSAVYLAKGSDSWDALAVAGGELGVLFCAIVLVTGPLWGRKAWGVYWTWDPRLTTTLLIGMIYVAYLVLRNLGASGEAERKFAAGLGLMGGFLMPVIHYSVQLWRGQHPTVITAKGGGLDPTMGMTLGLSFGAFTMLAGLLVWLRVGTERNRQQAHALQLDAAELDLWEES